MERSTRVLILRKTKWSEADLIIHALEPTGEVVHALARGALKSKKRFGGGLLEPTHHLEVQLVRPQQEGGLATLKDARLVDAFEGLRTDYDRLQTALKLLSVVDRGSPGGHFPGQFNLLGHALRALDQKQNIERVEVHFALKFLKLHGVLEHEDWMSPFLNQGLHVTDQDGRYPPIPRPAQEALARKVDAYVKSATA